MTDRAVARSSVEAGSRSLLRVAGVISMALLLSNAQAQPVAQFPEPTDVTSSAELMISYRHQEHMWQTPDGALHLLVNRGGSRPNPGLVLVSSFDGGVSWLAKVAFDRTNRNSTADGQLEGSSLSVVYGDATGGAVFAQMTYDSPTRAWAVNRSETVYRTTGWDAHNPTLAFDDAGIAWCSFALINAVSGDVQLRWIYRPTEGAWQDTGLVVGPTDNLSKERSGRPIKIAGGMGLIYRVNKTTYWATRANSAPPDFLSDSRVIHVGAARSSRSDPYASHFGVVADDAGHLHLAIADDGTAWYLRYSMLDDVWSTARKVNDDGALSYLQIGLANGQVEVALSASRGAGAVYLSNDYGETFTQAFALKLPLAQDGVSYKTGRVETATRSIGPLAVLQQYEDEKVQRLMLYKVPVP